MSEESEPFTIDEICEAIVEAFEEQKDDPISLVTTIDMYGEDVNSNYTTDEKAQYLETLLEQLQKNPAVVEKIGWDLPRGLLAFYSTKNIPYFKNLKSSRICLAVMKSFNEIALSGNARQCILSCTEILSELNIKEISQKTKDEPEGSSTYAEYKEQMYSKGKENVHELQLAVLDRDPVEFIVGLEVYSLFELLGTALKRVNTLYPSKYLSMTIAAMMQFFRSNLADISDFNFMLRRAYTFCRNYIPANPPSTLTEEEQKMSREELKKIIENDHALQGKLLRTFSIATLALFTRMTNMCADINYFCELTHQKATLNEFYGELSELKGRYFQLAFSYDVDLKSEFIKLIEESKNLYKHLPSDNKFKDKQSYSNFKSDIYKLSFNYQLQKIGKQTKLEMDPYGLFILSGICYTETQKHLLADISIKDTLYLYLRFVSPSLFSDLFKNRAAETTAQYWIWVAITNSSIKDLKDELKTIPSYVCTSVLQLLLATNYKTVNEQFRMIYFTLITRLLCLLPEDTSFQFVNDILSDNASTPMAKSIVLCMFKDLLVRTWADPTSETDVKDMTKNVAEINLNNTNDNDKKVNQQESKDKLPKSKAYLTLNEERRKIILDTVLHTIKGISKYMDKDGYLLLILNYINFMNSLSNSWEKSQLKEINETLTEVLEKTDIQQKSVLDKIVTANNKLYEICK
ncbi:hypothetical protein TBLA_0A09970 [Henningerozyma blattae CBS 6284]|uniref:Uncharacterized protein n=1 Tax=Henningerozyma blattae (strain ATCC 34711 / CBS 6284 / DSM 70876 / NBRC 10599 / NRRL Y-10934 / UCD 77-7) TaxID=1071380 RepID=I2GXC5_HENB6|nr:hypothetical protein TBLA_0A09970 [Tetrapisispora blattae CBS 6284]CCH58777.1 hypothetical protein TBLA_0A09970 [Tetrapisispora blattae CBS 6284]